MKIDGLANAVQHHTLAGVPPRCLLTPEEMKLLSFLCCAPYEGRGVVIDAGCGTGGSTFALADGLVRNRSAEREYAIIHAFARFIYDHPSYKDFFNQSLSDPRWNGSFVAHFTENLENFLDRIMIHAGDFHSAVWNQTPIEILFIDIANTDTIYQNICALFFPCIGKGSIIVHQDFERLNLHWIHSSIELLEDYFQACEEPFGCSLVLEALDRLPDALIHKIVADDFTYEERVDLIDRASWILRPANEGDVFDAVENARLSKAYCALRHGLKEVARRETLALAERPYFQRNRRYEWMIRDVMRGCSAG